MHTIWVSEIRNSNYSETFEESNSFLQKLECSVIVKPIDSNCSRGVNIADRFTYSKKLFDQTAKWSNDNKSILMEEYIDGPEFTVDGIVMNNKA